MATKVTARTTKIENLKSKVKHLERHLQ